MINVLLPEAGGIGALNIIKCLKDIENIRLIATDSNKKSVGLYLSDKYYIVPKTSDSAYIPTILNICDSEKIDLIFPSYDSLIPFYSKNKKVFEDNGVKVAVNDYDSISVASDKLLTYKKLKNFVPIADTYTFSELEDQLTDSLFPLIFKPRVGSGSKDLKIVQNVLEFEHCRDLYKNNLEDFIFQEYLQGVEYTVDLICDLKGNFLSAVPRARLEIKAGVSYKGITVKDPEIKSIATSLASNITLIGPTCFQIIKDSNRQLKLFEINPRICGTMVFSKNAGVNLPLITVKLYTGQKVEQSELEFKHGLIMLRYWEELYLEDVEFADQFL